MTLAVAVWCPFPFNPDTDHPKSGIVFAADTRYSYDDKTPPFDLGIKIIQLGRTSACVFAGDVQRVADVTTYLRAVFSKPMPDFDHGVLRQDIDEALEIADVRWRAVGNSDKGYAILLGFITRDAVPVLCALRTAEKDAPYESHEWGAIVGDLRPGDSETFEASLRHEIMRPGTLQPESFVNATPWMFPVGLAFAAFVKSRPRDSVGGELQIAAVSALDGFHQNNIARWHRYRKGAEQLDLMTPPVSFD